MGRVRYMVLILMVFVLAGCRKERADLVLMDRAQSNSAYKQFEDTLDQWREQHPEITVEERIQQNGVELNSLARLGSDHLPDIFITSSTNGKLFADAKLVLDLTGIVEDVGTFTYGNMVYAFPVMGESYYVLIYDPENYKAGDKIFADDSSTLLSYLMADEEGQTWFLHMIVGDREAAFTDTLFVARFDELISQFALSENIEADFAEGKCSAVLTERPSELIKNVKEKDPALYERLAFGEYMPHGYGNGLFINKNVAEDSEKLELCLDLCQSLSGLRIELEKDEKISEWLEGEKNAPIWKQYLSDSFWFEAENKVFSLLESKNTRECSAILQDEYEKNYLNVGDYSKLLDQYGR